MDGAQLVGLSIFASYFVLIIWLFQKIVRSLGPISVDRGGVVFLLLAAGSFAHTWYYMFSFMHWSFINFERSRADIGLGEPDGPALVRFADWLVHTGLFEQAWAAVCFGESPWSWWWSQQLCLFTAGAWTVLLTVEGRRRGVKYIWAYMLLGQVVAISVASNLFYYALAVSRAPTPKSTAALSRPVVPPELWLSVLLSFAAIAYMPYTTSTSFLPTLLVMHALLVIPLLYLPSQRTHSSWNIPLRSLYLTVAAMSLALHAAALNTALQSMPAAERTVQGVFQSVVDTLYYHPAQSSIGWDIVWTTGSFVVWTLHSGSAGIGLLSSVLRAAVGSVGFAAPVFFSGE